MPLTLDELAGERAPTGEAIVVYDELGAGIGSRIAISEGGEAAQPFLPDDQTDRRLQRGDSGHDSTINRTARQRRTTD